MDDLTSRNLAAVQQAINRLASNLDEERERRIAAEQQIAMLSSRVNDLTQAVAIMRYKQMGRGPTSQG